MSNGETRILPLQKETTTHLQIDFYGKHPLTYLWNIYRTHFLEGDKLCLTNVIFANLKGEYL
jgi:hypothetical protein